MLRAAVSQRVTEDDDAVLDGEEEDVKSEGGLAPPTREEEL